MIVRELYWRKYGVEVCPCTTSARRIRPSHVAEQIDLDREMAERLQRQLNDQEREREREVKRKERRAWYESFIQPYTFVRIAHNRR